MKIILFALLLVSIDARKKLPRTNAQSNDTKNVNQTNQQLDEDSESYIEPVPSRAQEPVVETVVNKTNEQNIQHQTEVPRANQTETVESSYQEVKQQEPKAPSTTQEPKRSNSQTTKTPSVDIIQLHFKLIEDLSKATIDNVVPIYYHVKSNKVYSYIFLSLLYIFILQKTLWALFGLFRRNKPQTSKDNTPSSSLTAQIADLKKHIDDRLEKIKTFDAEFLKEERKQTEEFMDFFEKNVTDVWKEIGQIKQKLNENEVNTLSNTNSFANELKQTMEDEFDNTINKEKVRESPNPIKESKTDIPDSKANNLLKPKPKPIISNQNLSPEKPKIGKPIIPKKIPLGKPSIPRIPEPVLSEPVVDPIENEDKILPVENEIIETIENEFVEEPEPLVDEPQNELNECINEAQVEVNEPEETEDKLKERPGPLNPFSLSKPKEIEEIPSKPKEIEEVEEVKPALPKFKPQVKPVIGKFKRPAIPLVKPLPNPENK